MTANLPTAGAGIPVEALISLKAFSATGIMAQLAKVWHAVRLVGWMAPFFWYCRDSVTKPKIHDFLAALKAKSHPDLPIGTAGFCWGGKWVTELCWDAEMNRGKDGKRLTDCGFTAHPSRLAFPGDIEKVRLPYSVAASEHDFMMSPVRVTCFYDCMMNDELTLTVYVGEREANGRDTGCKEQEARAQGG